MSKSSLVLSYDVGGSHISCGLCSLSNLELINIAGASLTSITTFDAFTDLVHRLGLETAVAEPNIVGVSLAVPGPFDTVAGVSLMEHKLTYLYLNDLRSALAERFGFASNCLCFLNDAAAYVLGEIGSGSIRGARRAVGLTLGTGIGSAFAIDGQHVTSGPGVPPRGEIWNYPYADGVVEDFISTRRIKADYLARAGKDCEVTDIAASFLTDPDAHAVFDSFGQHLGEVLRDIIAPFHPESVVIGGGISHSANLFLPIAEKFVAGLGFRVAASGLFERASLIGAAYYWRELSRCARVSHP